jgi:hypothetical protein
VTLLTSLLIMFHSSFSLSRRRRYGAFAVFAAVAPRCRQRPAAGPEVWRTLARGEFSSLFSIICSLSVLFSLFIFFSFSLFCVSLYFSSLFLNSCLSLIAISLFLCSPRSLARTRMSVYWFSLCSRLSLIDHLSFTSHASFFSLYHLDSEKTSRFHRRSSAWHAAARQRRRKMERRLHPAGQSVGAR